MLSLLRSLTLGAWESLLADYPPDPRPPAAATWQVLGLYLVAGLVLLFNKYYAWDSFGWVFGADLPDPPKLWNRVWWALVVSFGYAVPPALYVRWVLGRSLSEMGFRAEGLREHLPLYLLFFGVVAPFVVVLSGTEHFLGTYPMARQAGGRWSWLIAWELAYALQFVTLEFFFRGFLLHGPARLLGAWVVPIMVLPYLMLHFSKPALESVGSIIAGMALGMVALRTRSIYAGMLIHIAVAWSMDLLAIYHRGELQRLLAGEGGP